MSDFRAEPDRQDLLAAELAEHHLIEEELGRGGSATVYLAPDLRHGRRVALKVLHSALGVALGSSGSSARSAPTPASSIRTSDPRQSPAGWRRRSSYRCHLRLAADRRQRVRRRGGCHTPPYSTATPPVTICFGWRPWPIAATARRRAPTRARPARCWNHRCAKGRTTPSCWHGPAWPWRGRVGRPMRSARAGAPRRSSRHHATRTPPFVLTRLAEIYTLVNEPEEALGTLEPLLAIPSWISPGELRSDPVGAPLRIHPGFARLAGPA